MDAQANSTLAKPERFDLVSECSRFSPISRLSEDEREVEVTVKAANLDSGRNQQPRSSARGAKPKSLFAPRGSAVMNDYYEVLFK